MRLLLTAKEYTEYRPPRVESITFLGFYEIFVSNFRRILEISWGTFRKNGFKETNRRITAILIPRSLEFV